MDHYNSNVLSRASLDTLRFFRSKLRVTLALVVSLAIGFPLFWWFRGIEAATDELLAVAAFTFAPAIAFSVLLFVWNLFLTPSRLIMEQLQEIKTKTPDNAEIRTISFEPPDYSVWRKLKTARIEEIARLCVNEEPHSSLRSGREVPLVQMILQGVEEVKIRRADGERYQTRAITYDGEEPEYEVVYPELTKYTSVYIEDVKNYLKSLDIYPELFEEPI